MLDMEWGLWYNETLRLRGLDVLYRVITQNKNRSDIMTLLRNRFDGFTLYRATGVWKNMIEPALIIEIDNVDNKYFDYEVVTVCVLIKKMNEQECVLLQKIESESELI